MSHSLEHSFLPTTTHDSVVKEDGGSIKSAKLTSKEPAGMEEVGEVVQEGQYRLYRMRFAGCAALVVFNIVAALNWLLFTTIATQTTQQFDISLTQVNWFANIVCGMYVFAAPCVPFLVHTISIQGLSFLASALMVLGAWLRYAATSSSLSSEGAYALLFIGSALIGISQCFFQTVAPSYSETWFGLKSRTTSTSLIAIANPFGGAVASILAPAIVSSPSDLPTLLLIAGIVSSVVVPLAFAIGKRPPTPPTRSAEGRAASEGDAFGSVVVLLGLRKGELTGRERLDFAIVAFLFTVLIGFFDAFLTLTNQIFEPVGYDSDTAGFIGAAVIISGLVAALISAPLFDRYFQYRLALASKLLVPIIGISFFALIWAVKPDGLAGLYVLAVLMGISSFIMLPVALELAAEVVWKVVGPATVGSILYMLGNAFSVVTVVAMNALRAGGEAEPPLNMRKALIFQGVFVFASSFAVFGLRGVQARRVVDSA